MARSACWPGRCHGRSRHIAYDQFHGLTAAVDQDITRLGIEHDAHGNRAKAYLYCLETRDPRTGWMVPMAPSWVISKTRKVVAKLVPNHANKRYDIEIHSGVSSIEIAEAEQGTIRDGRLARTVRADRRAGEEQPSTVIPSSSSTGCACLSCARCGNVLLPIAEAARESLKARLTIGDSECGKSMGPLTA
jgi:hypothetical protein